MLQIRSNKKTHPLIVEDWLMSEYLWLGSCVVEPPMEGGAEGTGVPGDPKPFGAPSGE